MGSRSIAQVAPTSTTIALNAYIYGYAGHSLVTPHVAIKQLWWTDERIDAKVTRAFVVSKLRGSERDFLDRPLAFGEGLTDDTYMDWILERAKRFFAILADIGVPDQIFGCIDDSWSDEDLPLSQEDVEALELSYEHDDALNKKFYDSQFTFLLRELTAGAQIEYGPREHIPMEFVNSVPPAVTIQSWDRIHFPGRPNDIYMRRRFALQDKETKQDFTETFSDELAAARALAHPHIVPIWASYTADGSGFTLSDFVGEHTLQSFIDHRMPAQWTKVPANERPMHLCAWMHCLADALAFMHHRGVAHTAVRPSNVIIDRDNHIAFSDVGSLRFLQRGKKTASRTEVYDYAAPESQITQSPLLLSQLSPPLSGAGTFGKLSKMSNSSASSIASSQRSSQRSDSIASIGMSTSPILHSSNASSRNFSRHLPPRPATADSTATSTCSTTGLYPRAPSRSNFSDTHSLYERPFGGPEQSDVFSLACLFLDIVTFMLKGKTTDFVKHRRTRTTANGHGNNSNKRSSRNDISFHACPDRIESWTRILETDALKRATTKSPMNLTNSSSSSCPRERSCNPNAIYASMPAILSLIRSMMSQSPQLRPTARDARDALRSILVNTAHVPEHKLCCMHNTWSDVDNDDDNGAAAAAIAKARRRVLRDERRARRRVEEDVLLEESESLYENRDEADHDHDHDHDHDNGNEHGRDDVETDYSEAGRRIQSTLYPPPRNHHHHHHNNNNNNNNTSDEDNTNETHTTKDQLHRHSSSPHSFDNNSRSDLQEYLNKTALATSWLSSPTTRPATSASPIQVRGRGVGGGGGIGEKYNGNEKALKTIGGAPYADGEALPYNIPRGSSTTRSKDGRPGSRLWRKAFLRV